MNSAELHRRGVLAARGCKRVFRVPAFSAADSNGVAVENMSGM